MAAAAAAGGSMAAEMVDLGFGNGERPLVRYPQKRPLIRLTTRPPQLDRSGRQNSASVFGRNSDNNAALLCEEFQLICDR